MRKRRKLEYQAELPNLYIYRSDEGSDEIARTSGPIECEAPVVEENVLLFVTRVSEKLVV